MVAFTLFRAVNTPHFIGYSCKYSASYNYKPKTSFIGDFSNGSFSACLVANAAILVHRRLHPIRQDDCKPLEYAK